MQSPHHLYISSSTPHPANISLIMLFVLIVGSLIGLMTTMMMQSMIRDTSKYYETIQAHYTAKAGLELGTLAVQTFGYGYADHLSGDNDLLSSNLTCLGQKRCTLDLTIDGRGTQKDMRGDFNPGDGFVIPLIAEGGNIKIGKSTMTRIINTTYREPLVQIQSNKMHNALPLPNLSNISSRLNLMQLYSGKDSQITEFKRNSIVNAQGAEIRQKFNTLIGQHIDDRSLEDKGDPFLVMRNIGTETGHQMTFTRKENTLYPPKTISSVNSTASFGETFIGLMSEIDEPLLVDLDSTSGE